MKLTLCVVGPHTHRSVTSFKGEFPSVEDIGVAERALQDMRALIQLMQEEVAKFQEKKKEEEEQEQKFQKQVQLQVEQEAKAAEVQLAQAKAQKKGARIVFIQDCRLLNVQRMDELQNN